MSATTEVAPVPGTDDLEVLLRDVWSSYVGDPDELVPAWDALDPPAWTAAVSITGASRGTVLVELSAAAALGVARGMLGLAEGDSPDHGELTDAVGELVNVVGGNVKSLLPGPSALSLPLVAGGVVSVPSDLVPAVELALTWRGAGLSVRLLVAEDPSRSEVDLSQHPLPGGTS